MFTLSNFEVCKTKTNLTHDSLLRFIVRELLIDRLTMNIFKNVLFNVICLSETDIGILISLKRTIDLVHQVIVHSSFKELNLVKVLTFYSFGLFY